jgi:hypothetical protein
MATSLWKFLVCSLIVCLASCKVGAESTAAIDPHASAPEESKNICAPNSVDYVTCTAPHATLASQQMTCDSTGQVKTAGSCLIEVCESGFFKKDNQCLAEECDPGSTAPSVSCTQEISNSLGAVKSKSCNSQGSGYNYGQCIVTACQAGFKISNNQCAPTACVANQVVGPVSCAADIPHSLQAEKIKSCSPDGESYTYGSCVLATCQSGYILQGNSCLPQQCQSGEPSAIELCNDSPNATTAWRTKACNSSGTGYDYGVCIAYGCAADYNLRYGSCVPNVCTPNQVLGSVNCANELPYATAANKTKSCNSAGNDYVYSSCVATACNDVTYLQGGSCVPKIILLGGSTGDQGVDLVYSTGSLLRYNLNGIFSNYFVNVVINGQIYARLFNLSLPDLTTGPLIDFSTYYDLSRHSDLPQFVDNQGKLWRKDNSGNWFEQSIQFNVSPGSASKLLSVRDDRAFLYSQSLCFRSNGGDPLTDCRTLPASGTFTKMIYEWNNTGFLLDTNNHIYKFSTAQSESSPILLGAAINVPDGIGKIIDLSEIYSSRDFFALTDSGAVYKATTAFTSDTYTWTQVLPGVPAN